MAKRKRKAELRQGEVCCPKCGTKGSIHQVESWQLTYSRCWCCGIFHEHGAAFPSLRAQVATRSDSTSLRQILKE